MGPLIASDISKPLSSGTSLTYLRIFSSPLKVVFKALSASLFPSSYFQDVARDSVQRGSNCRISRGFSALRQSRRWQNSRQFDRRCDESFGPKPHRVRSQEIGA